MSELSAMIARVGELQGVIVFQDPTPGRFVLVGEADQSFDVGVVLIPCKPASDDDCWPVMRLDEINALGLLGQQGFMLKVDTRHLEGDELRFDFRQFILRAAAYAIEGYPSIALMPDDAPEWGVMSVPVPEPS